jgi:hypothetical protein
MAIAQFSNDQSTRETALQLGLAFINGQLDAEDWPADGIRSPQARCDQAAFQREIMLASDMWRAYRAGFLSQCSDPHN